jgi:hypothetical protein
MLYKTIHYSLLLGAGFAAVACAGNSAVKNPAQVPSETSGAPATTNKGGGSSVGTSGAAQERTPQQMDQWEKDHPRTAPEKEVPFMPTEKDYWEKKKAADTKSGAPR